MSACQYPANDPQVANLLQELRPAFASTLSRFGIPAQDREDLVQRTLLAWVTKRGDVRHPDRWLPRALRNECLAYWRARRRRFYQSVDTAVLELLDESNESPRQEQEDLRRDLSTALGSLPQRCRDALSLRYGLGCDPGETAAHLGYQRSGIYKVLERCLAALSCELSGYRPSQEAYRRA